jgi:DNA topoisomerase IA
MPKVLLHVAEKPSVAKAIAAALCPGSKASARAGPRNNKNFIAPVYEFEASVPVFGAAKHIVTSVTGHLMSVDFKEPYK